MMITKNYFYAQTMFSVQFTSHKLHAYFVVKNICIAHTLVKKCKVKKNNISKPYHIGKQLVFYINRIEMGNWVDIRKSI